MCLYWESLSRLLLKKNVCVCFIAKVSVPRSKYRVNVTETLYVIPNVFAITQNSIKLKLQPKRERERTGTVKERKQSEKYRGGLIST